MGKKASSLVWRVEGLPFQMACWNANTSTSRGKANFLSLCPWAPSSFSFSFPPIPLHTHTYPFTFCYRTGQGKEGEAAQKFVGQIEVLLFHFCNWSKRNTQCTVGNLFFINMTWNKGGIARKYPQFAFESCPSTNARLEPYLYWSSGTHALQSGGQSRNYFA